MRARTIRLHTIEIRGFCQRILPGHSQPESIRRHSVVGEPIKGDTTCLFLSFREEGLRPHIMTMRVRCLSMYIQRASRLVVCQVLSQQTRGDELSSDGGCGEFMVDPSVRKV
jgi:hypothetical protein